MAYSGPIDAFEALVDGRNVEIKGMPFEITNLTKGYSVRRGVDFCSIEVTFSNNTQYGITAFGDEAKSLCDLASKFRKCDREIIRAEVIGVSEPQLS